MQNCYRDLAEVDENDLGEISQWRFLDSKSRRDRNEIAEISPRLPRSRRDYRDLAEIVEISPWCLRDSKSRRDCGEISFISARLPRSRRDLQRSRHDVCEILNLGEIAARFPPSRRDCRLRSRQDVCGFLKSRSSSRRDEENLAAIGKITPWSSTLSLSQ